MCEGEFESLKAIHAVTPDFVPKPYAWGKYKQDNPETYFLLAEFREVGKQVRAVIPQAPGKHVTYVRSFMPNEYQRLFRPRINHNFPFPT